MAGHTRKNAVEKESENKANERCGGKISKIKSIIYRCRVKVLIKDT